MDADRFDALARVVAAPLSRRVTLGGLAAGVLSALGLALDERAALAGKKGRGKAKGKGKGKGKGKDKKPSGLCAHLPDGQRCDGECGVCSGDACVARSSACLPCHRCEEATLACVPLPEGSGCAGECGTCQGGECLPDGRRCLPCGVCDASTLDCQPNPDTDGAGCGGCGICLGGTCSPEKVRCPSPDCQLCDPATLTCQPNLDADGARCRGCGVCLGGDCAPTNLTCPSPDCQRCDPATFDCVTDPGRDGRPCGDDKVCQSGACVDIGSCPAGTRCREVVWDVDAGRYVEGRLLDCCDLPARCEACRDIPDPGSPTGFRCDEFDRDGRCLRQPQACVALCQPENCQACVAGEGHCQSVCDITRQVCRAGACTCVPAGEACPGGGGHYCCGGACDVVAHQGICT